MILHLKLDTNSHCLFFFFKVRIMYVKCFVKEQLLQVDLNSMKGTHGYCTNYTKCGIYNPDIILDATIDVF